MEFSLNPTQMMIQQMVRKFAVSEVKPTAADTDETAVFPWENVRKMQRYGLMGTSSESSSRKSMAAWAAAAWKTSSRWKSFQKSAPPPA